MNFFIKIFFIYFFLFQNISYAYLDPGTGSSLLQILLALLAGIGAYIGFYWKKMVIFIRDIGDKYGKKKKNKNEDDSSIS